MDVNCFVSAIQRVKRLSVPLLEMPPIDPSDGPVDSSAQPAVVVLRQKLPSSSSSSSLQTGNREKDKSTKRKSNLNRALTDEQVLAGQIESQGSLNSCAQVFFLFSCVL